MTDRLIIIPTAGGISMPPGYLDSEIELRMVAPGTVIELTTAGQHTTTAMVDADHAVLSTASITLYIAEEATLPGGTDAAAGEQNIPNGKEAANG